MLNIAHEFPLLNNLRNGGKRFVYLDSAATSQKPEAVIRAVGEWYSLRNANPHRGTYNLGKAATDVYEDSRRVVAAHINALPEEIVFCRNTSEAINLAAFSFFAEKIGKDDRVVIPISEHHSNFLPWQKLCREKGAQLDFLLVDRYGRITDDEIREKICPGTRVVTCAQVSNVLGTVYPVEKIVRRAREVGAYTLIDCAQGLLHCGIDTAALDADFCAFSSHKAFGPNGIGVLWGKARHLNEMPPFLLGGEMVQAVTERNALFETPPMRFEAGTQDPAGAYGFAVALNYIDLLGREQIREHEAALTKRLLDGMRTIPNIKIYGNTEYSHDRCGIVAFNLGGQSPLSVAFYLDQVGIALRAGTHCAQPLLSFLGTGATCRVSVGPYNTTEDIDYFLDSLAEVHFTIAGTTLKGR